MYKLLDFQARNFTFQDSDAEYREKRIEFRFRSRHLVVSIIFFAYEH